MVEIPGRNGIIFNRKTTQWREEEVWLASKKLATMMEKIVINSSELVHTTAKLCLARLFSQTTFAWKNLVASFMMQSNLLQASTVQMISLGASALMLVKVVLTAVSLALKPFILRFTLWPYVQATLSLFTLKTIKKARKKSSSDNTTQMTQVKRKPCAKS